MTSQVPFLSPSEMKALMSVPSGGVGKASTSTMMGMFPPGNSSSSHFFATYSNHPGAAAGGMMGMPLSQRPVPEFLYHLTRMLRDPANHHLIEWNAGRIFVHDPIRLEAEVLGKYYRHSKYSSFQRQLNYFGFNKHSGKRKMSPCSYTNDNVTDSLDSLIKLRRKPVKKHRPTHPPSDQQDEGPHGHKKQRAIDGRTISSSNSSKPLVPPVFPSLAHQVSCLSTGTTPPSDVNNSSHSDIEHGSGHKIDLDSFRSGLGSGGIAGLFGDSFQPHITANDNNKNTRILPTISSALSATNKYCTQPLLVSAEEYKAPGECAPLRGVLPAPVIKPALPFPVSHRQHQPVVTPLPSSLDGSGSSLSDNSAPNSSSGVRSTVTLHVPNIFSVQLLQQQEQQANKRHQPQDTDDDLATFLALESAFGAGFDERGSAGNGADDNLSEGSASASGDSWLPDPL